jgi:hypothetical protein
MSSESFWTCSLTIEFKIEMQPGTAPITKASYKMPPVKMKELKIQLKDCSTKVISAPVPLFGLVQHYL